MGETVEGGKRTKLPMACRCGEEGRAEWDAKQEQVLRAIWGDVEPEVGWDRVRRSFVSQVCMSLNHDFWPSWNLDHAYADMWFGITVESTDEERITIACDQIEDGLAAVWLHLDQTQGRIVEED